MKNSFLISIVIAGYNVERCLKNCLDSVYMQSDKDFEVIFVNNGSVDNTRLTAESYPGLKIINNAVNKGFCFATNQGIKMAMGDYILTLNSDIILDKDFLKEMKKAVSLDNTALFSGKILDSSRKIGSTGLVLSRFYRLFDRGGGEMDMGQYDKELDIFGPCAAAALYKREMLEDVKHNGEYFDDDFFFLVEDFDLAWRAQKRKWKARFVPSATCYHIKDTSNFSNKFRQYLSFRNRFFLLIKHRSIHIKYVAVFLVYDFPRLIYMLFTNRYTPRALYEIVKFAPKMLRKNEKASHT